VKTAPPRTAIAAPGGAFVLTESQRPTTPSPAASSTAPACQTGSLLVSNRTVAAGTTKRAVARSAPIAARAETTLSAIRPRRTASGSGDRNPRAGAVSGSKPVASHRRPSRSEPARHCGACGGGEDDVAPVDQQEAAEEQRLDVGAGVEDVAREDDPEREGADEHQRRQAVVAAAPRRREPLDAQGEERGCRKCPERGREAQAVGEHEARERRGCHRVRVEREPAHHDPGAEEAGSDGQQEHLEHAPLDEGVVKRREHLPANNTHYQYETRYHPRTDDFRLGDRHDRGA